jgi:hypothetical protein
MVAALIHAGADVHARTLVSFVVEVVLLISQQYGRYPLHLAADKGQARVILLLVKAGADVFCEDSLPGSKSGKTPLQYCSQCICVSLLQKLMVGLSFFSPHLCLVSQKPKLSRRRWLSFYHRTFVLKQLHKSQCPASSRQSSSSKRKQRVRSEGEQNPPLCSLMRVVEIPDLFRFITEYV